MWKFGKGGPARLSSHLTVAKCDEVRPQWPWCYHWRIVIYNQKIWLSPAYPGPGPLGAHSKRTMDKPALTRWVKM
ncbi:hypothetical protein TNCV_4833651 [Trichonephila clavipes]|nr:hypothetical protein TNCV_4833651 [Trichonephila clavipes]